MISNKPLIIGHRSTWGGEAPFVIHPEDGRFHTYIIGKTGSGKTTLLRNLILQHIHQGQGIAIIDPHGDLAEDLLHHLPTHRTDHLVYLLAPPRYPSGKGCAIWLTRSAWLNPGDVDHPIAFNPLANVPPDDRPLVASGIVDAFKTIWGDSWGPRLAYILHNCIAALLDCENTSLLGVNRMLIDPTYRRWVVKQVRDPFIKQFWESRPWGEAEIDSHRLPAGRDEREARASQMEFEGWDARFQREAVAPVQNKIGALLQSPILRNILGQVRNKVSIPFVMDNRRIFIANLSKGRLGQDKSNLIGSLLIAQFQLAAMARSRQPEANRVPFSLYVDEFQNFSTDSFASILAEARKYRLSLTLSHQPRRRAKPSQITRSVTRRVRVP